MRLSHLQKVVMTGLLLNFLVSFLVGLIVTESAILGYILAILLGIVSSVAVVASCRYIFYNDVAVTSEMGGMIIFLAGFIGLVGFGGSTLTTLEVPRDIMLEILLYLLAVIAVLAFGYDFVIAPIFKK